MCACIVPTTNTSRLLSLLVTNFVFALYINSRMTITKHKNNYPQITCPFLDIQSAHCARIHTHKINFFVYQSLTVYCESKRSTLQTKQILSELFMALIFAQRLHETTIFHFFLPIPLFLFVSKIHALSLSRPRSCFLQLHVSLLFFNF